MKRIPRSYPAEYSLTDSLQWAFEYGVDIGADIGVDISHWRLRPRSEVNIELNFPPKLRGARSRLYRRRFLQVNTRWKED